MEEIKKRVACINQFLNSSFSYGVDHYDYEVVCIHLRKILELIAFSNLAANKNEVDKMHKNIEGMWNARKLLKLIGRINPDFYPKPIEISAPDSRGVKIINFIENGYLTKEEWVQLYNLCSDFLHVWNPYNERERFVNFKISVSEWVQKIQNLLGVHTVQLLEDRIFTVFMNYPMDGKVHAFPAEPADESKIHKS